MSKLPTIILGADHAGFELKEILKQELKKSGFSVAKDLSPELKPGDDYPLVAKQAAEIVAKDADMLGLLVCGTGLGMDIAANRVKGIRAVVVRNPDEARLSREHNHANILVLGGWITKPAKAKAILHTWLDAKPSKATRHVRRVKELGA